MKTRGKLLTVLVVALATVLSVALVQAAPAAPPPLDGSNSWAFSPPPDQFADNAVLDLRSLNEQVAGEKGYVRLSEDGNSFVLGDGTPVRFWALDSDYAMKQADLERHCRFLAKLGVNMARIGFTVCNNKEGAAITDVNEGDIDSAMRFVATAKKYGIYTLVTPYWAATSAPKSWGLEGISGASPWGVMFFNKKLQDGYKAWVKELYTRPNPYDGGLPLSQEPAVGIIQIQNEDGVFFWTMQAVPAPQKRILDKRFGDWLIKKYKSLDAAKAAWDGNAQPGDDFPAGVVAMVNESAMTWAMTQPQTGGAAKRMADEVEFLARLQHDFYADMETYYRTVLGCKQLINANNWRSGDPVLLEDLERWTYTANEVVALNRYCGVIHVGANNGYRIDPGHLFVNQPVVLAPGTFPGADKQIVGHPFIITETAWVHPDRYQSAGPFHGLGLQLRNGRGHLLLVRRARRPHLAARPAQDVVARQRRGRRLRHRQVDGQRAAADGHVPGQRAGLPPGLRRPGQGARRPRGAHPAEHVGPHRAHHLRGGQVRPQP